MLRVLLDILRYSKELHNSKFHVEMIKKIYDLKVYCYLGHMGTVSRIKVSPKFTR